jgi:hypothetical protein
MKTKMFKLLFSLSLLMTSLSFAAIPVKRVQVQNQTIDQFELISEIGVVAEQGELASPDFDVTTVLLWFFLGGLGMHRFYMGDITIGILQLLTLGGFGIWWLIDGIRLLTGDLS